MSNTNIPAEFICPISQNIMRDPVLVADGYSYERSEIERWLSNHDTSPMTNLPLTNKNLIPNYSLKSLIDNFTSHNGGNITVQPLRDNRNNNVLNNNPQRDQYIESIKRITPDFKLYKKEGMVDDDIHFSINTPSVNDIANIDNRERIIHNLPVYLVMVIDISGSMSQLCESNAIEEETVYSRLELVKHSVKTIISSMNDLTHMAIIAFDTTPTVCSNFIQGNDHGKEYLTNIINSLDPRNSTNIYGAIDEALKLINNNRNRINGANTTIALLTDGRSNHDPSRGVMHELKSKYDINDIATINTFGFSYDIDYNLLDEIANFGNGSFMFIPDFSMIGTVFVNFISNIMNTCFYNCSLTIDSVKHNLGDIHFGIDKNWIGKIGKSDYNRITFEYNNGNKIGWENILNRIQIVNTIDQKEISRFKYLNILRKMINMDYNDARRLLEFLYDELSEHQDINNGLLREIHSNDNSEQEEQIMKAVSREDWKRMWGNSHILSNYWGVYHQLCNNFKDPSVQTFAESISFIYFRDIVEQKFLTIPAPAGYNRRSGRQAEYLGTPMSAVSYYNNSGSCFSGNGKVKMADGSIKLVSKIRKGDEVVDLSGRKSRIRCVVTTIVNPSSYEMVKVNDLWITPWHPVKITSTDGWKYPSRLGRTVIPGINEVYNFVLFSGVGVCINGMDVVTMGHGIINNPIISHPFFGTNRIIYDLKMYSPMGWEKGFILLDNARIIRDEKTNMVKGIRRR